MDFDAVLAAVHRGVTEPLSGVLVVDGDPDNMARTVFQHDPREDAWWVVRSDGSEAVSNKRGYAERETVGGAWSTEWFCELMPGVAHDLTLRSMLEPSRLSIWAEQGDEVESVGSPERLDDCRFRAVYVRPSPRFSRCALTFDGRRGIIEELVAFAGWSGQVLYTHRLTELQDSVSRPFAPGRPVP